MQLAHNKCQLNYDCDIRYIIHYVFRYEMMRQCWDKESENRLTFSELVSVISTSLERMSGYLDLTTSSFSAEHTLSEDCEEKESKVED